MDGVSDNADAFDDDPTETTDSDSDGVGTMQMRLMMTRRRPQILTAMASATTQTGH